MKFYRQCLLFKCSNGRRENKITWQHAWIEEKYAKKNKAVKIAKNNSWEDGWIVSSVGTRASEKQVRMYERQHLKQRGVSDI